MNRIERMTEEDSRLRFQDDERILELFREAERKREEQRSCLKLAVWGGCAAFSLACWIVFIHYVSEHWLR